MEGIHQKGVILSQLQFKKSSSGRASSRFIPLRDGQWHYRIDGSAISFWRSGEVAPFGGWRFADGCKVVDACSMPFADGSDGIVIGVNSFGTSRPIYFLAYYSFSRSSVVKMIAVKNEITCLFVLIGNLDKTQILELNQSLRDAPHWIAVGTKGGSCYLTHFNLEYPTEIDLRISSPVFSTNVSKHYIQNNSLVFDTEQGELTVELDKVSVTAISYIPKCWLLLIGFSCGAVVSFSLSPTPIRIPYVMYDGPVHSFAWQEPNDDPRPTFYLWIAYNASVKRRGKSIRNSGPQVLLAIVVFPDDEGKPFHEWTYKYPRIQKHFTWSPGAIGYWVSVRTVLQIESSDRLRLPDRSTSFDESSLGSGIDSTLLLLVWINQKETALQGALFDLNALYYKRLIKSVIFDETVAHQCPFLSLFTILDKKSEVSDIQDVIACPDSFMRFSGPLSESNDALFYPSALSFEVIVLRNAGRLAIEVRSIQEQVLEAIENDIVDAVGANVNIAAQWMTAVGLADPNCTFAINTEWYEASQIITGLLNHGCTSGLRKWLELYADEASRDDFTKFLWDFVQDTKEHFDENSAGLFAKISTAPPKWTVSWLKSAYFVFSSAEELFGIVQIAVSSKNSSQDAEVECHRRASANLTLYTRIVLFMLKQGVLPESSNYGNIFKELKESVEERYAAALSNGKRLFIHELLDEIKRFGKDEDFWSTFQPMELYPPKTLLILFDPVLALQITTTAKLKLLGYFFMDYDRITKRSVFGRFRNVFLSTELQVAEQIVAKYNADCSFEQSAEVSYVYDNVSEHTLDLGADFRKLMKYPLLDETQYEVIKDSLLKEKDGITKWNGFCIAKQQLNRLIEPTKDLKDAAWKNICDQWTKRFIKEIPRLNSDRVSSYTLKKWKDAGPESSPSKNNFVCVTRRRPKRRTTLHETLAEFRSAMELRKRKTQTSDETPENKRMKTPEREVVDTHLSPVGDSDALELERVLPKENLERIKRILQTPPSARRLCRSKNGNLPIDFDITPENIPTIPTVQPTSILKSGAKRRLHRDSESGSPHLRLRFDLPSSDIESSLMTTTSSVLTGNLTDGIDDGSGVSIPQDVFSAITMVCDGDREIEKAKVSREDVVMEDEMSYATSKIDNPQNEIPYTTDSPQEEVSYAASRTDNPQDEAPHTTGSPQDDMSYAASRTDNPQDEAPYTTVNPRDETSYTTGSCQDEMHAASTTDNPQNEMPFTTGGLQDETSLIKPKIDSPSTKRRKFVKETCYEATVSPSKRNDTAESAVSVTKDLVATGTYEEFVRTTLDSKNEARLHSRSSMQEIDYPTESEGFGRKNEFRAAGVGLKRHPLMQPYSKVQGTLSVDEVRSVTVSKEEEVKTERDVDGVKTSETATVGEEICDSGEALSVRRTRTRTYSSESSPATLGDHLKLRRSSRSPARNLTPIIEQSSKRRTRGASYSEGEGREEEKSRAETSEKKTKRTPGKRPGLRSADKTPAEAPTQGARRSPSRGARASSVPSSTSVSGASSRRANTPLKTPKRGQRAASEVPADKPARATGSRRRIFSEDESATDGRKVRVSRIRAGRKTVDDVLKTIEESPSRSSTRLRRTPVRYPL